MNLKHTALITLLMLLLQHTGSVFAAISIEAMGAPEWSDVQLSHDQSNTNPLSPHHHQALDQSDSASMHHEDRQHCQDCQCCSVLGCYGAVNVPDLPLLTMVPTTSFPEFHFIYTGTNPAGLYRPPTFL